MYAKKIISEEGIYSIDKFVFDIQTSVVYDVYKLSFDNLVFEYCQKMPVRHFQAKKFDVEKEVYQFGHFHIELWKKQLMRNIGSSLKPAVIKDTVVTRLRLDFNPNKCEGNEPLKRVLVHFSKQQAFSWSIARVDYAFDVKGQIGAFYCLTRKTESFLSTTRYYGVRGNSGYLRIYDKREEVLKTDRKDLGYDLTRFEWEQRGNNDLDFTFDRIARLDFDGLRGAQVLQFVPPELIDHALSTYDKRTASKIRKQCFTPVPFDPYHFRVLLRDYLEDYGLSFLRRRNFKEDWENGDAFSM